MRPLLVVLLGPTGVGKTDTSIGIAKQFGTEIISADSRQIFKELCIGTAAPTEAEMAAIPHWCVRHKSIHEYYNASIFEFEVLDILDRLFKKNPIVLMSGGSMMYIDAVCNGIDDLPNSDPELRAKLTAKFQLEGIETLQQMLKELDPEHYEKVDLQNHKRVIKALEVSIQTGIPYSKQLTGKAKVRNFDILKFGLTRDRAELYDRINNRVDIMLQQGLEAEAKSVYPFKNLNSLNTVGYTQFFDYFDGTIDYQTAVTLIKRDSRHYAKRQLSWFNRDKTIHWFHPNQIKEIIDLIEKARFKTI